MSTLRARQNARLGIVYLEQAVLEVLLDAKEPLTTREIMQGADIPRAGYESSHQNGFVHGTLGKLLEEGLIEKCSRGKGEHNCWQLTSTVRDGWY